MRPILISDNTRVVLRGFTPEPVSLAALKASGIPIEWYEGVAIVQEASRHLLESPPHQSGSELSAATVRIDLTGTVFVSGNGVQDGPSAVSQLGALLRDLLPDTMPVPLRLAVSQAMSNPPHYASVNSFSQALSYFERPDRTGIVRALYQRWETHADAGGAPEPHVQPQSETQPASEEPPLPVARKAPTVTRRWTFIVWGIGLAVTLGAVLGAVQVGLSFSRTESSPPPSDRSADAAVVESAIPELARPGTTMTLPVPPPATSIQNTRLESARARTKPAAAPVAPPTLFGALGARQDTMVVLREILPPSDETRRAPREPNAVADLAAGSNAVLGPAPGSHIYSVLDADVAAPVAVYPQSPTVATVLDDDEMLTFDVVIDRTGNVESVKLLRAPSTIRSAIMVTMSLSVAKAWRFQPATRHGQSVRYRQSFSVPVR